MESAETTLKESTMNTRKSISELTSNQYWRGMNRRFDKRVRLLAKLGVRNIGGVGWPSRRARAENGRLVPRWIMTSQFVMHADRRVFREYVYDLVR